MKEGWRYKRIGEITNLITDGDWIESRHQSDNGFRLIQTGNIGCGIFKAKDDKPHFISETTFKELSCTEIFEGDCLISRLPDPVGRSCLIPNIGNRMITAVDCTILRFKKEVIPSYFVYYTQSNRYSKEIEGNVTGATRKRISRKNLEKIQVPVPPLLEQQHIVEELDLLSSIIEKKKALLNELDKLAQSIFYEMFGDPTKTSKGWEVKKMGDVCILKSGNSDANKSASGDLPYVKVGDMNLEGNETYIVLSSTYVDRVANARNIFPIGTIIFPKRGGAILTNKKRLTKTDICCDLNVMGVIPNTDIVIPLYVYYYFLRIDFSVFANTGSTIPQINNYDIAPMNIVLPPMDVQKQFASNIDSIEGQKELIKQSIKEVETMYNSRMDFWFN